MSYFGRLQKREPAGGGTVALPAGKTLADVTPQPNKLAASFHGMNAGFHRRTATALVDKDPEASKKHLMAAHAHEAAKYAHSECMSDADSESTAANTKSTSALALPDSKAKGKK